MASTACRMATWFSVGEKSTRHSSPLAFQACLRQIALQDISVKRIIFHCYEISRTVAGKCPLGTPARFQGRSTRHCIAQRRRLRVRIYNCAVVMEAGKMARQGASAGHSSDMAQRSEEHTSELQS